MLIRLIVFAIVCSAESVSKEDYDKIPQCGDGKWDGYNEECDSTEGCGEDCFCQTGYSANGAGRCVLKCLYGEACQGGCASADVCEVCSSPYNEDCQLCVDDAMWFGEGVCKPFDVNDVTTCGSFFDADTDGAYSIKIGNDDISKKISVANTTKLYLNRCTRYTYPGKPYTYGQFIKLTFEGSTPGGGPGGDGGAGGDGGPGGDSKPASGGSSYISIEVGRQSSTEEAYILGLQKRTIGTNYALSMQTGCSSSLDIGHNDHCTFRNGGMSEYMVYPRIITVIRSEEPQYLFVHTKYAADFTDTSFTLYISHISHPCVSTSESIDWNDVASSGFTTTLDLEYSIQSMSACSKQDILKGFWFKLPGAAQTVSISTCRSEEADVSLDLISVPKTAQKVDCDDVFSTDGNKADCVKTRSDGCGANSKMARMLVTLETTKDYYLFVSINEEYTAKVVLDVNSTCPQECGENGICSTYSGRCECNKPYINSESGCTLCGNGIIDRDKGEECDNSNSTDPLCTKTCNCIAGAVPVEINGVYKCAVPTCGNGAIDEYEECDGGYGCDHCVCTGGTTKYAKARQDCMPSTCGNKRLDDGEECDGGDGCVECECQDGWYKNKQTSCSKLPKAAWYGNLAGVFVVLYYILYASLAIIFTVLYIRITRHIRQQIEDEKMVIFENTIIPFDKTNSQYIDIRKENPYFSFSSPVIEFSDIRPEINEPVSTHIVLTNKWKDPMHFTFHSGDYTKYEITCKPFTGTIRSGDSVTLEITFMAKCTTLLNDKVPITIRFGQLGSILKEIRKENPDLILDSNSSQNSEADSKHNSTVQSSKGSGSHSNAESSVNKKKKAKISKFHVYMSLQVESALSTKLDYEEIHLQHPPIGGGTFGIVYRAEWRRVDVAVKVMKTDLVGLTELLPNFMQEAEMMERIRCPYIVNFIGSVATADTLCLVTEFCPLGSLRKFLKTNALSDLQKIRFCQDISRGMEYLHHNDILHRDLKTDNVLVYSKNPHDPVTAKVTDFGTSRSFIESSGNIALQNIGTPVYMAPEISRKDQMTLKSDVYSFAICMLEIWLGHDPYDPVKFPDSDSILRFVCSGKRLEIDDRCFLKDIIEKAWDHQPTARPTFKEIGAMLDSKLRLIRESKTSTSGSENSSKRLSKPTTSVTSTTTTITEESIEASQTSIAHVDNESGAEEGGQDADGVISEDQ